MRVALEKLLGSTGMRNLDHVGIVKFLAGYQFHSRVQNRGGVVFG